MAVEYGTIAVVPMGTWENSKDYDVGNLVELDGSSYVAKVKPPVGMLPTDTAYWQISAKGASKATVDIAGVVKPDGVTTEVDANASLSVKKATQSTIGIVKGSDDIKVGADGSIDVDTTFTQATELANIIAGEAIASVLGKVSKAIAITMSLDQNALLKNMLTSIDGNSSEKVPTQAYIHTLVERIGMGTELTAGANLTEVANELSSNLADKLLIKNTTLWSGKNYADDYRAESMIFYCNPVQGNLTAYNFPVNETGVFKSIVCNQFVSQTYITINNALYQRIAADSSSPFSAWELK